MEKGNFYSQVDKIGEPIVIDIKVLEEEVESLRSENENLWERLKELQQDTFQKVPGRNPRIEKLERRLGKKEG